MKKNYDQGKFEDLLTEEEKEKGLLEAPPIWREIYPQGFWGWTKAIASALVGAILVYVILVLAFAM